MVVLTSQESTMKDVKLFGYDFRGHAEGSFCSRDSLWLSLVHESSNFSLFFFLVLQVKNRLFSTYPLPLCKPLWFVQFGLEVCPAAEYLCLKKQKAADES